MQYIGEQAGVAQLSLFTRHYWQRCHFVCAAGIGANGAGEFPFPLLMLMHGNHSIPSTLAHKLKPKNLSHKSLKKKKNLASKLILLVKYAIFQLHQLGTLVFLCWSAIVTRTFSTLSSVDVPSSYQCHTCPCIPLQA